MEWITRPGDAGESWPADELRMRMRGIVVAVRAANGETVIGVLDEVAADALVLEADDELLTIDVAHVEAYAVAPDTAARGDDAGWG